MAKVYFQVLVNDGVPWGNECKTLKEAKRELKEVKAEDIKITGSPEGVGEYYIEKYIETDTKVYSEVVFEDKPKLKGFVL